MADQDSASYEILLEGLDAVLFLAKDLGLSELAVRGRFGHYRRLLHELIDVVNRRRSGDDPPNEILQRIEDRSTDYRIALNEVREISRLAPLLSSLAPNIARTKLSDVLDGPSLPSDESPTSNHARNIQFELTLAALLKRAGYAPQIGEHPDLLVRVVDRDYAIECKRIFSPAKVDARIAEAAKQLHRDKKNALATTRGIVAISLARFLSANDEAFRTPGSDNARRALEAWLERIRVAARPQYHPLFSKGFVVAVFFYTAASFENLSTGRFDYGTQWSAESYVPRFAVYKRSMRALQESLVAQAH